MDGNEHPRRNFFRSYSSYVFDRTEQNFPDLISSLRYLHSLIESRYCHDTPTLSPGHGIDATAPPACFIPLVGRSRESVLEEAVKAFDYMIRWHHPYVLHNINPPAFLDAVAVKALTSLYNPNCLWDFVSGRFFTYERSVATQISTLFGWDAEKAGGVFTFGGKATLMYAIKLGINRSDPDSVIDGLGAGKCVVITSDAGHYSIEYACNLLGIGARNCIRVGCDSEGRMSANLLAEVINKLIGQGRKIACIILSGGNSLNNLVDPIAEVKSIIDEAVAEHSLAYTPHLHVDSVIGWIWLFYKYYNFGQNNIGIEAPNKRRISVMLDRISEIEKADSAGVDFHKNGFCSYPSSLFVTTNQADLLAMNGKLGFEKSTKHGEDFVQHYTIEHSRSGEGVLAAWVVLQELGVDGFQRYIAQMMTINTVIQDQLSARDFEVINPDGLGFAVPIFPRPLFFNGLYNDLTHAPLSMCQLVGQYCRELFEFVSVRPDITTNPIIGFIPNYAKRLDGLALPAIRLYPMTPLVEPSDISNALAILSKCKAQFDQFFDEARVLSEDGQMGVYPK